MKKSDLARRLEHETGYYAASVQVLATLRLAEEAIRDALGRSGAPTHVEPWDPEEPELPARVRMHLTKGLATLASEDPASRASTVYRDLTTEEYLEAAARYNAAGRFIEAMMKVQEPGGIVKVPRGLLTSKEGITGWTLFRSLLAEEREHLHR